MTDLIDKLLFLEKEGTLAGSWLITGEAEEKKADLIRHFTAQLFHQPEDSYFPSVKWIERPLTDDSKKALEKAISSGKTYDKPAEYKSEIPIDSIREIGKFLSMTFDCWRILIINRAEDMNEKAQNALLKMLEEPPQKTIFFLLSDNKSALLPTLLSRCRQIRIFPSSENALRNSLKNLVSESEIDLLMEMGDYNRNEILSLAENDAVTLYQELLKATDKKSPSALLLTLAQKGADIFPVFRQVLYYFLVEKSKTSEKIASVSESVTEKLKTADVLNLDKKQSLFQILTMLKEN